ncbi:hypothetical protein [Nocardia sp. NPDC052566]|uniref:hypothetical protein n=1 Tax=Nocardia sp. NPDC052566 TaxID=3364330 RepID=UPI0037C521BD
MSSTSSPPNHRIPPPWPLAPNHQRSTTPALQRLSAIAIDTHHNLARFAWRAAPTDGTPPTDGLDLVEFTPDGRIQRIIGFFGPLE